MKIPNNIRNKRLLQTQELYNTVREDLEPYQEQIYQIIHNDELNKDEKYNKVKDLIYNSLEKTMSYIIKQIKTLYPQSFNTNAKINLEDLLYNKDNKTLEERIAGWFVDQKAANLTYQMWLILSTETENLIPRTIQIKLNHENTYVEIVSGGGECTTGICEEYADGEAYLEDQIELPPYHPGCQCEAVFYDVSDVEAIV